MMTLLAENARGDWPWCSRDCAADDVPRGRTLAGVSPWRPPGTAAVEKSACHGRLSADGRTRVLPLQAVGGRRRGARLLDDDRSRAHQGPDRRPARRLGTVTRGGQLT